MGDRNEIYMVKLKGEDIVCPYSAYRLLSMISRNPSSLLELESVTKWVWNDETRDWEMVENQ